LKAAAGCFGLLGVVTHITFELESMIYPVMKPEKTAISLAIPPLQASDVPMALRKNPLPTDKELQAAKADFENRAANDFYAEWFWYTYQTTAWVNSWSPVKESKGAKEFPSPAGVFLQWLECWVGGWFSQTFFFQHIPGHWQAQFLAIAGMAVLPPTTFEKPSVEIKTFLPDGLHFFRGVSRFAEYLKAVLLTDLQDSKHPSPRHGMGDSSPSFGLRPFKTRSLYCSARLVGYYKASLRRS
jgi:hypothetical protein